MRAVPTSRPPRTWIRWRWLAVAIAGVVARASPAAPTLSAHDLSITHATLTFTPGRYQLDVVVDPESLLARLEIYADRTPSTGVPAAELADRIRALGDVALARTTVAFDGVPAMSTFQFLPTVTGAPGGPSGVTPGATSGVTPGAASGGTAGGDPSGATGRPSMLPAGTIRFTGDVPAGARQCRVTYGLVLGSYALTLVSPAGQRSTPIWIAGGQPSPALDLRAGFVDPPWWTTAVEYASLGFTHILPKGLDHILFVVGLFLLGTRWRPLLLQVTLFTIAHSVTLGLSMLDIVSLPSSIVEPLIAFSIAYVAVENLFTTELSPWRGALVFLFGLLHGLGFAGVLGELGMPRGQFGLALVSFNVGVELGQLSVIALATLAVGWWRLSNLERYRRWVVVPVSAAIAIVGLYWTATRALG
ncbi:MAG: HupE/UreJ family protein [Vicinamibacteria bacterium]